MLSVARFSLVAWLLIACSVIDPVDALAQAGQTPLKLHPQNDRYLLFREKPTVLVTSAEHYGLLLNRAFDFESYFDELASHGLNHTRVFSGAYREVEGSFGITQNPLAPIDANYICPWKRSDKTHRDGSPIFDLKKWDQAYFQRLDSLMNAASKRGVVVEMCLFSPMYKPNLWDANPMNIRNNVNQIGDCGSKEVYTTKHEDLLAVQTALAEKMVERMLPYDNLDYSFSARHPTGTLTDYNSPGGGSRELRRQLAILKSTFDQLPIPELRPQTNAFVKSQDGFVASAIGRTGSVYLIYVHVKLPGKLKGQPAEGHQR